MPLAGPPPDASRPLPRVTAVVVAFHSAADLPRCLRALLASTDVDLDVVVVDNASADGSPDLVRALADADPRVRLLANPTNVGYAAAVDQALAVSDAPVVATVNPDVEVRADLLARCAAELDRDPGIGSVQPTLLRRPAAGAAPAVVDTTGHVATRARLFRNRGEGSVWDPTRPPAREVFGVSGACAVYRRAMLDDVALDLPATRRRPARREVFDADLFAFFEDVDLDWRAQLRGWRAVHVPEAVAVHERGGAGPRRTPHVERLNAVNRLAVLVKCDDRRALLRVLPLVVLTTLLKLVELALTVPGAAVRLPVDAARTVPAVLAKRRLVQQRATVAPAEVVARWFGPLDWRGWVGGWWRRVRPGG
ncbi:MAG: glycosyltransferase [Actinomycetes bacterium]